MINKSPINEKLEEMQKEDAQQKAYGPKPFSNFLLMLEDGRLHSDLSDALQELNAQMNDHAKASGGKAKGSMSLSLDFVLKDGVFEIIPDFKVKEPKLRRDRTILWSTPENNFTGANPRQMDMFGVREVPGSGIRTV